MTNSRSGRYVSQPSGYSAFVPETLPIPGGISFDGGLQIRLSKADRALGRLDGAITALPNPDLFVLMYVRKEAALSSQIEGTQASLTDVLKAEARIRDPDRPDDVTETLNYVRAMKQGLERLKTLPISLRLIREIHKALMTGVRGQELSPGEFRTSQNWISPQGIMLKDASFVPPPPHLLLDLLGNLETYIHADDDLPFLLKVGVAHAQFETIHPFLDGNGRLGRLLITFMLCEREILLYPVLYLSHFFKQNRGEYYERLQSVRDHGDWQGWLNFFLLAMTTVASQATETSRAIVALRENHRQRILDDTAYGAGTALTFLESLYQRPYFDLTETAKYLGISQPGAKGVVDRLERLGIVEEITGQKRNRIFAYTPYLALFEDGR